MPFLLSEVAYFGEASSLGEGTGRDSCSLGDGDGRGMADSGGDGSGVRGRFAGTRLAGLSLGGLPAALSLPGAFSKREELRRFGGGEPSMAMVYDGGRPKGVPGVLSSSIAESI